MEARIARLESDVGHMRADLADMKVDVRALRDRIDDASGKVSDRFDARIDGLKDALSSTRVWALALYVALAAGIYSTMARGFGWL